MATLIVDAPEALAPQTGGGYAKVPTYTVPILKAAPAPYPTPTPAPPLVPAPNGGITPAIPVPGAIPYEGPQPILLPTPELEPVPGVTRYPGPLTFATENGEPARAPAPGVAPELERMAAVRAAAGKLLALPPLLIAGAAMLALWLLTQARRSR